MNHGANTVHIIVLGACHRNVVHEYLYNINIQCLPFMKYKGAAAKYRIQCNVISFITLDIIEGEFICRLAQSRH